MTTTDRAGSFSPAEEADIQAIESRIEAETLRKLRELEAEREEKRQAEARKRVADLLGQNEKGAGKQVLIRLEASQRSQASGEDTIVMTTQGRYYKKRDKHYLIYQESHESGMGQTTTRLIYSESGEATLQRIGEQRMRMDLRLGQREVTAYQTPHGLLQFSFLTKEIRFEQDKKGACLYLVYEMDSGPKGEVEMRLAIRFDYLKRKRQGRK